MSTGGINTSTNTLNSVAGQQQSQATQLSGQGQSLISEGQSQQAPLAAFLQSIIGGDSTKTNAAIAPAIGNITASTNANKEAIYDSTAPGAARDVLLGQNKLNQGSQIASTTNSTFLQAFPELAQLGSTNTNAGLGLTGAGITSLGNSASTTGNVLNAQEKQKASTISAFGSLAGIAGSVAGGLPPGLFAGGGGAAAGAGGGGVDPSLITT